MSHKQFEKRDVKISLSQSTVDELLEVLRGPEYIACADCGVCGPDFEDLFEDLIDDCKCLTCGSLNTWGNAAGALNNTVERIETLVDDKVDLLKRVERLRDIPFEVGPDGEPNGPSLGSYEDLQRERDALARLAEELEGQVLGSAVLLKDQVNWGEQLMTQRSDLRERVKDIEARELDASALIKGLRVKLNAAKDCIEGVRAFLGPKPVIREMNEAREALNRYDAT